MKRGKMRPLGIVWILLVSWCTGAVCPNAGADISGLGEPSTPSPAVSPIDADPTPYVRPAAAPQAAPTPVPLADEGLRSLVREYVNQKQARPEERNQEALDRVRLGIRGVSLGSLSPFVRCQFVELRLQLAAEDADWPLVDALVEEYRLIPNKTLADARALRRLSFPYMSMAFPAPASEPPGDTGQYWWKHYRSPEKAIALLKEVVDNYDGNYYITFFAKSDLAHCYEWTRQWDKALETWESVYQQDIARLYALPEISSPYALVDGAFRSADRVWDRDFVGIDHAKKQAGGRMARAVSLLPFVQGLQEAKRLRESYPHDAALQSALAAAEQSLRDNHMPLGAVDLE